MTQPHEPWCTDHQAVSDVDYCQTERHAGGFHIDIVGPDRHVDLPPDDGGVFFYDRYFPNEPLTGRALDDAVAERIAIAAEATAVAAALVKAADEWRESVRRRDALQDA